MGNYVDLCDLMSKYPDVFILRTFSGLNVRNLLYYQAELLHLEQELQEVESEDQSCEESPRKRYAGEWRSLGMSSTDRPAVDGTRMKASPRDSLQWQIFLKIREVLTKYNETLTQQASLSTFLAKPQSRDLTSLRGWLKRGGYGNGFLAGKTEDAWDIEKGFHDFRSIRNTTDSSLTESNLTYFVSVVLLHLKRLFTSEASPENHIHGLTGSTPERVASGIVTVVASICPVLPIVILFFIPSLLVRLGMILVFTAILTFVLVFGMQMQPDKVLTVTTAQG